MDQNKIIQNHIERLKYQNGLYEKTMKDIKALEKSSLNAADLDNRIKEYEDAIAHNNIVIEKLIK
jgi:hypothetical protein